MPGPCRLSDSTAADYAREHRRYLDHVRAAGADPADPAAVARYLRDLHGRGRPASSVRRARAAIDHHAVREGRPRPSADPEVQAAWADILGSPTPRRPPREVLVTEGSDPDVLALARAADGSLLGLRDRALVLVGAGAGLRATELVGLSFGDVRPLRPHHVEVRVGGHGPVVVHTAARGLDVAEAVRAWADGAGTTGGPFLRAVDRHGNVGRGPMTLPGVTVALRRLARAAGLDDVGRFSSGWLRHALR